MPYNYHYVLFVFYVSMILLVDVQDPTMTSCPPMDITVTRYDAANSSVPVFSDNSGIIDVRFTLQI